MDLAILVLRDDGCVVGPDRARCMQVLDNVVVGSGRGFVRVCAEVEEYSVCSCHVVVPLVIGCQYRELPDPAGYCGRPGPLPGKYVSVDAGSVTAEPGPDGGPVVHMAVTGQVDHHPVDGPAGGGERRPVSGRHRRRTVPPDADGEHGRPGGSDTWRTAVPDLSAPDGAWEENRTPDLRITKVSGHDTPHVASPCNPSACTFLPTGHHHPRGCSPNELGETWGGIGVVVRGIVRLDLSHRTPS